MSTTRRALIAWLVIAALASTGTGSENVDAQTFEDAAPELPAMIVTPTDLGFAGMAAYPVDRLEAKLQSALEIADEYAMKKGVPTERAIDVFVESGFQQRYWHMYVLKYPDDPVPSELAARRVSTSVFEFPDDESAAAAFDSLARLLALDAPAINAGIVPIGDDSRLSRAEVPNENDRTTHPEMSLTFRSGKLIANVTIADEKGEPDLAAVETLATQLLDRMTTVTTQGGPELSTITLRIPEFEALNQVYDGYNLMGGGVIVGSGEPIGIFDSADVTKTIEASAAAGAGALDGYQVSYYLIADQGAWKTELGTLVYRFYDENQATDWIGVLPSRLNSTAARNLDVTELSGVGEQSFVASYGDYPDVGLVHQIASVRVGAMVAIIYGPQIDSETTRDFLAAQAECLDLDGCSDIFDQKSGLRDPVLVG